MKKSISIAGLMLVGILAFSNQVHSMGFGGQETIHKIVDVKLKGANSEKLFLGYKTYILFFIAGIYVKDEGYVLGISGSNSKYYPFPSGEELKNFQASGMLPTELPEYSIPFIEYVFGYSLWIILIFSILSNRFKRSKEQPIAQE